MATQRNKSGLVSAITGTITTNGTGDITGAVLNTLLDDFTESMFFSVGATAINSPNLTSSDTGTSGTSNSLTISPTVVQSSTAGYNALKIAITETSTGSGDRAIIRGTLAGSDVFVAHTSGLLQVKETTTPSAPSSGNGYFYFDSADSLPKAMNDAGTEFTIGGGDVTKVGTPVNNQIGVWTGDGTLEGDAGLTFDSTTDNQLDFGSFSDSNHGKIVFDTSSDAGGGSLMHSIEFFGGGGKTVGSIAMYGLTAAGTGGKPSELQFRMNSSASSSSANHILTIAGTGVTFELGSVTFNDGRNLVMGTTTGSKIGTSTSQKIGFWNATPVIQQNVSGSTGGNAALQNLLSTLATLGLITDSTT